LDSLASIGDGLFAIALVEVQIFRVLQILSCAAHAVGCVFFRTGRSGDHNRILSFVEFEGCTLFASDGMKDGVATGSFSIGSARQQREMSVD